jgi:hypothetical protein
MSSYLEASNAAARTVLCSYFSVTDAIGRAVRQYDERFAIPIPFVYDWFRRLCNDEPPNQPSLEPVPPSFTGGQCPVLYTVNYNVTYDTRSIPPPNIITAPQSVNFVWGTIKGLRIDRSASLHQLVIIGGASGNPGSNVDYGAFAVVPASGQGILSAEITSVARQDGMPDNCGDLPSTDPPLIPPDDSTTDFPIVYTNNDGIDITVDARFVLGNIQVDVDNNISVPFTLSFAPEFSLSLNGTINQNGDVNINYGNPNYNPGGGKCGKRKPDDSVADEDTPETPEDVEEPTLPPEPDENEDEQTGVIRAVIVTTTVVNPAQSIVFQDVNPDIYIPRLGNVSFLVAVGNKVAWTDDIPVRNKRHFIVCPWEGGAIDVRGTPAPGNNFTLSKVYAREQYPVQLLT